MAGVGLQGILDQVLPRLDRGGEANRSSTDHWPDSQGRYWALCPYHEDESNDLFHVSLSGFLCHRCNAHGSLLELADKLDIEVKRETARNSGRAASSAPAVMEENELLKSALAYAHQGWPVFPCRPGDKRPATAHGVKDATTKQTLIAQWWQRWPTANIGIDCGGAGLVVIDLDVKNGAEGIDNWAALRAELGIDDHTPTVCTPNKGLHLYYAAKGPQVRNSASKLGRGIDVRAVGGYVVAPPSRTPEGVYGWEMDLDPSACPLLALPEPLALAQATVLGRTTPKQSLRASATIAEGGRNDTLARMAGAMRHQGLEVAAIEAALLETNAARCSPPLPQAEVRQIAASIGRYAPVDEDGDKHKHCTDLGNARRLLARHGQGLHYCAALGGWLVWDGKRWLADETGQVTRYARDGAKHLH